MGTQSDVGKLALRLLIGIMLLCHGVAKIFHGVSFIEAQFVKLSIPAFLAYSVFLGEIVAPLMLIVGYRVKIASFLVFCTMAVIFVLVHTPSELIAVNKHGALVLETLYFYAFGAVAVFFLGAGKFSIDRR